METNVTERTDTMGLLNLRAEHLKMLDSGKVDIALQDGIKRAVLDCKDRPHDPTKRVVTLKLNIVPMPEDNDLDQVHVEFEVESKVPVRRSKPYPMKVHNNGQLSFSEHNPTNPDQATMFDADSEGA
jgi:hypothetical protein